MRKKAFIVFFLLFTGVTYAQRKNAVTDFNLSLNTSEVSLGVNQTKTIEVEVIRSKFYTKQKATLEFRSLIPESLKIDIQAKSDSKSIITFQASPQTPKGRYDLLLNCQMTHINHGVIVQVLVE